MIVAGHPDASPRKLLAVARDGTLREALARDLATLLRPGDLVVANDAATLPASLHGTHIASGAAIEVRLAGRPTAHDFLSDASRGQVVGGPPARTMTMVEKGGARFIALVFGAGDYRTRTEDRALPPPLQAGDVLMLGPLQARVVRHLDHARLVELVFDASEAAFWSALARHGRAIQYAHQDEALALWDVWTKIAGVPVAFEAPSAGFVLSWAMLAEFAARGIGFATLTHAAGISSTGDASLDQRLPFDEAYDIPRNTVAAIRKAKAEGGRIVAIGTSVVRALEHAAKDGALRAGRGVASGRLGPATALKLVDAIVSGVHAAGESHFELLRAFVSEAQLREMAELLERRGFRNHEFGDFVLIERAQFAPANGDAHSIAAGSVRVRYSQV